MNSARPDRPEDSYDPAAINHAASQLDVYRHERLAYTEIPPHRPKARPVAKRVKTLLTTIYYWVCARS